MQTPGKWKGTCTNKVTKQNKTKYSTMINDFINKFNSCKSFHTLPAL